MELKVGNLYRKTVAIPKYFYLIKNTGDNNWNSSEKYTIVRQNEIVLYIGKLIVTNKYFTGSFNAFFTSKFEIVIELEGCLEEL